MRLPPALRARLEGIPPAAVVALGFGVAVAAAFAWTRAGWLPLSPDDATYLNVGRHLLAGEGPIRVDQPFLIRSPLFGAILALPERLGFDLIGGAHRINLGFTVGACLAAGALAWRSWGASAGLLAVGMAVAQPLAARYAPTLRIDALAALIVLGAVGLAAELGRTRLPASGRSIALGTLLGLALLVKEPTAAMAGGIVLIPLAMGRPVHAVARDVLLIGSAAVLTCSWWLAWHGVLAGRLPYFPLPAIALVPLLAAAIASLMIARRWHPRARSPLLADPWKRWAISALGTVAWSIASTALAFIAGAQRIELVEPGDVLEGFADVVPAWPLLIVTMILGLALAPRLPSLVPPTLAGLGFMPTAVLVIVLDFGARNFLVWTFLACVAGAGLVWLATDRLARSLPRLRDRGGWAVSVPLVALGLVVASVGLVSAATAPAADGRRAEIESDVRGLAGRLRAMAAPGETIVVTSPYGWYLDLLLGDRNPMRELSAKRVRADEASPTGLARNLPDDRGQVDEVMALTYRSRSGALQAFELRAALALLRDPGTRHLVYITYAPVSPPWLVSRFEGSRGLELVERLPVGPGRRAFVFRIDPDRVELGNAPPLADAASLEALLDLLEGHLDPDDQAAALRILFADGIELVRPDEAAAARALDRLRRAMSGRVPAPRSDSRPTIP